MAREKLARQVFLATSTKKTDAGRIGQVESTAPPFRAFVSSQQIYQRLLSSVSSYGIFNEPVAPASLLR